MDDAFSGENGAITSALGASLPLLTRVTISSADVRLRRWFSIAALVCIVCQIDDQIDGILILGAYRTSSNPVSLDLTEFTRIVAESAMRAVSTKVTNTRQPGLQQCVAPAGCEGVVGICLAVGTIEFIVRQSIAPTDAAGGIAEPAEGTRRTEVLLACEPLGK